jgi:uncharacterized BrkB/YihY/UPF0761 family membrane protein
MSVGARTGAGVRTAVVSKTRPAWDRVMVAHRRYTSANGDALAGSVTYALLVCSAPALLLVVTVLSAAGAHPGSMASTLRHSARLLLPDDVAAAVGRVPPVPLTLRVGLVVALLWTSLRLVRALRTAVRAMCGQNAGSGNPIADAARDAGLGVLLLAAVTAAVAATGFLDATVGPGWGAPAGIAAVWLVFTGLMLRFSWPQPGRPAVGAALRAALVGAVVVWLLTLGAHWYFATTAELHRELYRAAGTLVGVLVWCSLAGRTLLRATAWASTVEAGGS